MQTAGEKNPQTFLPRVNYHTHTPRCHHAIGDEREYIENAIAAGLTILGFSDHTPYVFAEGYTSGVRMTPEELPEYVDTLLALRKEYKNDIEILIGLETEYYPAHFDQLLEILSPYPLDYMILGQHFLYNEYDGIFSSKPCSEEKHLAAYVDQVIAGLSTGKFAYLAHPDMLRFVGDEAIFTEYMTRLCRFAKEQDIPLEMNFLGFADKRHYPSERFLRIAAEIGNEVIFGCDAHQPYRLLQQEELAEFVRWVESFGLRRTEQIRLTMR